jgi:hypothetical protein
LHFLGDIGGSDEIFSKLQASLGDENVKRGWDIADDNICVEHCLLQLFSILDIDFAVGAAIQSSFFCQFFSLFEDVAGDVDAVLREKGVTLGLASR